MTSQTVWPTLLIVGAAAVGLFLLFVLLRWALRGAGVMFSAADKQGFLGFIAYVAAWVFMFPVMLVISILIGAFMSFNRAAARTAEPPGPDEPPIDPEELRKWVSRLPPYER